jgi:hypothetical protein
VRFHVTHGAFGVGATPGGGVDEAWAAGWEAVFAHAAADGLQVMPVFGVWADWNDGSAGESWHAWEANPLNRANGGPAASPVELFRLGSPGQRAWIGWMEQVVQRWKGHANIAAWEVFSELDLVTHAGDAALFRRNAVSFFEAAAARLREVDPLRRPVTASAAGWSWPELYRTPGMELVQIHLYGPEQQLDAAILSAVRARRAVGKPILLGESGLDWRAPKGSTQTTAAQGPIGTRHAVWAALVAGAMNGRALWWEDGYAILENGVGALGTDFVVFYPAVEAGALAVLAGRSLAGFAPVDTDVAGVGGAVRGAPVTLTRAGPSDALAVPLPAFADDVAFVLEAQAPGN